MIKLIKRVIGIFFVGLLMFPAVAKADGGGVTLKGNFQTEGLVGQIDSVIGANEYNGPFVSNSYLDLSLASQYVTAGARLELLHCPLPGFESNFAGGGLPNVYVTGKYELELLVNGKNIKIKPWEDSNIEVYDEILYIDNNKVSTIDDLKKIINEEAATPPIAAKNFLAIFFLLIGCLY